MADVCLPKGEYVNKENQGTENFKVISRKTQSKHKRQREREKKKNVNFAVEEATINDEIAIKTYIVCVAISLSSLNKRFFSPGFVVFCSLFFRSHYTAENEQVFGLHVSFVLTAADDFYLFIFRELYTMMMMTGSSGRGTTAKEKNQNN